MVVGITGASGIVYGIRLLELLRDCGIESHLVMSRAAQTTLAYETSFKVAEVEALATVTYPINDIGAACSSGSFKTMGMIVAPCSIKTVSEIATGTTNNLISRSADVALKERRRVVLLLRETPLHLGHIRSLAAVTELSVPRVVSSMMGMWLLATAFSETLAAQFGKLAAMDVPANGAVDIAHAATGFADLFWLMMWIGLGCAAIAMLASPWLRRAMRPTE